MCVLLSTPETLRVATYIWNWETQAQRTGLHSPQAGARSWGLYGKRL